MSNTANRIPLSPAQLGIWAGTQLADQPEGYQVAELYTMRGSVEPVLLRAAIERANREVDALNMRFADGAQELGAQELPVFEYSNSLENRALELALRPLDLSSGPVAQHWVSARSGYCEWLFVSHHIALDGFGYSLFTDRVSRIYNALLHGDTPSDSSFGSFTAAIDDELKYLKSTQLERDRDYWHRRLENTSSPCSFGEGAAAWSLEPRKRVLVLDQERRLELDAMGRGVRGSWVDALLAVIASALSDWSGADEVVLGLPVTARTKASRRVPNMSMNIVPLRVATEPSALLGPLLSRVADAKREMLPHVRYRYERLRRELGLTGGGRRLFGPVVNIMPFDQSHRFGASLAEKRSISAGPVEDVAFNVYPKAGRLEIELVANPNLYSVESQQAILDAIAAMVLEPRGHRRRAGRRADATPADLRGPPLDETPPDIIERLRTAPAERIALEDGRVSLTYGELRSRAARLSVRLESMGIATGSVVALFLPRSIEVFVAIYAILARGATYLSLDCNGPHPRLRDIIEDARPALVLTLVANEKRLRDQTHYPILVIDQAEDLDSARHDDEAASLARVQDDSERDSPMRRVETSSEVPAYILYTSGSTGRPCGVVISRGALAHFASAARQQYRIDSPARILQFAPLHFDASVEEMVLALASTGTLVLRDDSMMESMRQFLEHCRERRIEVLDLPTAFWHELSRAVEHQRLDWPPYTNVVIVGGEALRRESLAGFFRTVTCPVRVINSYGPTETTVVATSVEFTGDDFSDEDSSVTVATSRGAPGLALESIYLNIGTPLPGLRCAVVDSHGRVVVEGEEGELCITGPTLALEYLNQQDRTRVRFGPIMALSDEREIGSDRAYRTRDRALVEGGKLIFRGRLDREVKLSGQRVDLDDVERVIVSSPAVRDAAVIAHESASRTTLIAFIVPEHEFSEGEIRSHLEPRLSAISSPARIIPRSELPMSTSGKVDRHALAALFSSEYDQAENSRKGEFAGLPDITRCIVETCRNALGLPDLALADDFFARGVESLRTIRVANELSIALGRDVPVSVVFEHPSCEALVRVLRSTSLSTDSPSAIEESDIRLDPSIHPYSCERSSHSISNGAHRRVRHVLLTGSTGFVGAHILSALSARSDLQVTCLVRAEDEEQATNRVHNALSARRLTGRFSIAVGDISKPSLGLARSSYECLSASVDAVIHSAASVSLTRSYGSLRAANVLPIAELLRFCATGRAKTLVHLSTVAAAIGGRDDERAAPADSVAESSPVPEAFVRTNPATLPDGYSRSKWAAEELLRQAAERGFSIHVLRLGRVFGRRNSAVINTQDILFRILAAGLPQGVVPDLKLTEPWTPIELVQGVLDELLNGVQPSSIANVIAQPSVPISLIYRWLEEYGYGVERAPPSVFHARLKAATDPATRATMAFLETQSRRATPRAVHFDSTRVAPICRKLELDRLSAHRELFMAHLESAIRAGIMPAPLTSGNQSFSGLQE